MDLMEQRPHSRTIPGLKAGWVGAIQSNFFCSYFPVTGKLLSLFLLADSPGCPTEHPKMPQQLISIKTVLVHPIVNLHLQSTASTWVQINWEQKTCASSPSLQLLQGIWGNLKPSKTQQVRFSHRLILQAKILHYPYPKTQTAATNGLRSLDFFALTGCSRSPLRVLATLREILESPLPSGVFLPSRPRGNQ